TSALGVAYWLVAAHLMTRADLGRGSSLLSVLLTVSALAQLNYVRTLPGLLPRAQAGATRFLAKAYIHVIVVSIVLGLAFSSIAPHVGKGFAYLLAIPAFVLLFSISVPIYSVFSLEDAVLATVRRAEIIPFENAAYGIAKLALLIVLPLTVALPTG